MDDVKQYVQTLGRSARRASAQLATLDGATKTSALRRIAEAIRAGREKLLAANAADVSAAQAAGLAPALVERLKLNDKRIASMADGVEEIAAQVDPVGQILDGYVRPNGLRPGQDASAPRRGPLLLRITRQRHQRRGRVVPQERQRHHPPRRQRGDPFQPGHCVAHR